MNAALHLDERVAHVTIVDADGLQHERRERDVPLDVRERQVHQLLIDLDPLDVHAGGEGAGDTADVELHAGDVVRNVPRNELKTALSVHRRPDDHRRHGDDQEDQEAGEDEEQAAHGLQRLQLRREVDVQTRARAWHVERLRHVDADGHHRQAHPQAHAERIVEHRTEVIEGVAVVDEGRDP